MKSRRILPVLILALPLAVARSAEPPASPPPAVPAPVAPAAVKPEAPFPVVEVGPDTVPSPAEEALRALVARQVTLIASGSKDNDPNFDPEKFRTEAQDLTNSYEDFLKKYHDYAPGYAAYGVWLGKVDMRKQSAAILLKSNELFGKEAKAGGATTPAFARTWALVKNQLGNYIAEEGRPLEAVSYFIAATELTPNEPLYHYQLGTLLYEARSDFVNSGEWTRAAVDQAMSRAFRRAAELAPDRIEFTYRYAESFYDLDSPDWDEALKAWAALEDRAGSDVERQTMRLHAAHILIIQEKFDHARALLATITEEPLQKQKQKLLAELPAAPAAK